MVKLVQFPLQTQLLIISFFPQYKHGGPIIAVQVENEYGSYNRDPAYMPYIKKVRVSLVYFFTFFPLKCSMGYDVTCWSNSFLINTTFPSTIY